MEIQEIIKHCQKGNQIAQGSLFNSFYKPMYNLSMRFLANHHDVEDVLITSFIKVFKSINEFEFRGENSLHKWIKTIVINESIRFCSRKKQLSFEDDFSEIDKGNYDSFCTDLIDTELVFDIIEKMPVGYRLIFNLFAIEGYSHKEISEMLNISENTSKSQLRKARLNIIEKLNKAISYEN